MTYCRNVLLLTVITFLTFKNLYSQPVEIPSVKWSGSLTASGLYQSGNTNKFFLNGRGEIKRSDRILETILSGSAGYGESKRTKDDNTFYGSFTADFFYEEKWSPFFLQNAEYNFSKGIDLRTQTGAGLKYTFIQDPAHKTSLSLAGIYDYLKLVDKPGNSRSKEGRLSLRFKSRQVIFQNHLNVLFTALYQPVVTHLSKRNFYIETNMEVPLTGMVKLNILYTYSFDDVVSVGRKRADNKLTFGGGIFF